jgi:tRNA (guanine37-N1)-methyltransferase
MFAGVGPFSVALADSGADVVAADVNSDAVELLIENAARNGVADQITAVDRDARDLVPEFAGTADRIVMNLPHSADAFLDTAVALARDGCTVHYYGFGPEDAPFKEGARSIRETATDAGVGIDVVEQRVVRSYAPGEVNVVVDARLHTG